jgi:hypothetical protein
MATYGTDEQIIDPSAFGVAADCALAPQPVRHISPSLDKIRLRLSSDAFFTVAEALDFSCDKLSKGARLNLSIRHFRRGRVGRPTDHIPGP